MSTRAPLSITPPGASPIGNTLSSAIQGGKSHNAEQAVTQQNQAAQLNAPDTAPSSPNELWRIPELSDFQLESALENANKNAYAHLQNLLKPDGMYVEMPQYLSKTAEEEGVLPQATIKEQGTDKPLKNYSEQAILQLYAHNKGRPSIIVDGKV